MAPPRNRRRKVPSRRIDAALAAMRPMGFPDSVVRKRVKELLKVYGEGDEGWYFIEECSYKLLIETILEDGNGLPEPEYAGNVLTDEAGSSGAGHLMPDETVNNQAGHLMTDETVNNEAGHLMTDETGTIEAGNLITGEAGNGEGDGLGVIIDSEGQNAGRNSCLSGIDDLHKTKENHSQYDTEPAEARSELEFAAIQLPMPIHHVAPKTIRKPCYGWISDDDDDNDFILLRPAATAAHLI